MGRGGRVVLINGTKYAWRKIHSHTYQMNHFKFPERIEPAAVHLCYFEWNENMFKNPKDDKGEVVYQIEGTGYTFQIGAEARHGFDIYVKYDNLSNLGNAYFHLGFDHDGFMPFVLAGRMGKFVSTGSNARDWMSENLDILGNRMLKDLCLPGAHDAGMSQIHSPTFFANKENTQTQAVEIGDQLNMGIRFFDIRPIIGAGNFHTGHYSKVGPGWQGARGQSLDSIVNQLNDYTSNHKELILINLSHGLNTDLGNSNYRPLNQEEYERCFQQLKSIQNLFILNESVNLRDKPLNYFLKGDKSAVLIVLDDEVNLGPYHLQGFYSRNEFPIDSDYANSNNLNKMIDDQLRKLALNRSSNQNYFLISWILTLQGLQNVGGPSIEQLAHQANTSLYRLVLDFDFKSLIRKGFPNVICQDFVTSDNTAIALSINHFRDENFTLNFVKEKVNLLDFVETTQTGSRIKYALIGYLFLIICLFALCIYLFFTL